MILGRPALRAKNCGRDEPPRLYEESLGLPSKPLLRAYKSGEPPFDVYSTLPGKVKTASKRIKYQIQMNICI
jgi:hypothetical protein